MIQSWGWASTLSRSSSRFFGERFAERREEPHGGRKQDAVALFTGPCPGPRPDAFCRRRAAEEQRILALLQIWRPVPSSRDQFHINGGLDLKVERLQRLLERNRAIANRIARCLSVLACTSPQCLL
ncbi:MAG: hypothetical protein IPO99_08230 [Nitrospira sp.]|nr:hypothetical protein [Nitrospira sp.]